MATAVPACSCGIVSVFLHAIFFTSFPLDLAQWHSNSAALNKPSSRATTGLSRCLAHTTLPLGCAHGSAVIIVILQ